MSRDMFRAAERQERAAAAIASGAMEWRAGRLHCTVCTRSGIQVWTWMDACLIGHPHTCPCGRKFASKSGISAHQQQRKSGKLCKAIIAKSI